MESMGGRLAGTARGKPPFPPPRTLPGFPGATRAPTKTPRPGGGERARWEDDEWIYEWDYQHGTVERYDRRGRHTGEFDHETGRQIGPRDPARRVEP
jgi:hypothetical protein